MYLLYFVIVFSNRSSELTLGITLKFKNEDNEKKNIHKKTNIYAHGSIGISITKFKIAKIVHSSENKKAIVILFL